MRQVAVVQTFYQLNRRQIKQRFGDTLQTDTFKWWLDYNLGCGNIPLVETVPECWELPSRAGYFRTAFLRNGHLQNSPPPPASLFSGMEFSIKKMPSAISESGKLDLELVTFYSLGNAWYYAETRVVPMCLFRFFLRKCVVACCDIIPISITFLT
jgi:hypothetical protein